MQKQNRGFRLLHKKRRREISSMGGRSQGKHNNLRNFANDTDRAKRAGHKGGLAKHTA